MFIPLLPLALAQATPEPQPPAEEPAPITETAPPSAPSTAPTPEVEGPPVPAGVELLPMGGTEVTRRPEIRPDDLPKTDVKARCLVRLQVDARGVSTAGTAWRCPAELVSAAESIAIRYRFKPYRVHGVAQPFATDMVISFR